MLLILQNIRIPRVLASFMVGTYLSVFGLVYQTTFNNKLVSPSILGVSSGCCVGAGIAILLGMSAGMIRLTAFVFGFIAVSIALLLPRLFKNHSSLALVISGIIVVSFMDSILALIKYIADRNDRLADIIFWIMGNIVGIQYDEILSGSLICVVPVIILFVMGWRINVVSLGTEECESLGINYRRNRLVIIVCAALLTANCVSISGNVGWGGLGIPHIARAFVGDDVRMFDYLSLGRTPHLNLTSRLSITDFEIIEKYAVRLGVDEIYDVPFNKLSGGQKQMVAITKSLIQDTPIVILDEPMSALDIGKQVDLLKLLYEFVQEGKTIVLTTHNPNHALAIESDACFLQHSAVVAFGRSNEIIKETLLHEIYGENIILDHGEKSDSVVFNTDSIRRDY